MIRSYFWLLNIPQCRLNVVFLTRSGTQLELVASLTHCSIDSRVF